VKCEKKFITEDYWDIAVLRRNVCKTAMDQLMEANETDWRLATKITFVGEAGLDSRGLSRDFFSLCCSVALQYSKMGVSV
jgi:hypothetical protein